MQQFHNTQALRGSWPALMINAENSTTAEVEIRG